MSSGLHERYYDNGNSGAGTITLSLGNGPVQKLTLTASPTLAFSNPPASGVSFAFTIMLAQDGTGSRGVTWPASVKWADATTPTLSNAANAMDMFSFMTVDGGTTWYGVTSGKGFV